MNLLIDNNDGRGQQDYTAWVDAENLPKVARKLNRAATMTASLVNSGQGFTAPVSGARVVLQCGSGGTLFTGSFSRIGSFSQVSYATSAATTQPTPTAHPSTSFTPATTIRWRPCRDIARLLTPWRMSRQERDDGGVEVVRLMRLARLRARPSSPARTAAPPARG